MCSFAMRRRKCVQEQAGFRLISRHSSGFPWGSNYFIEEEKEVKVDIGSSSKETVLNKKKVTVKALSLKGSTILPSCDKAF